MHVEMDQRKAMYAPFLHGFTLGSALMLAIVTVLLLPLVFVLPDVQEEAMSTALVGCIPAPHDLDVRVADDEQDVMLTLDAETLATLDFSSASEVTIVAQDGCAAFVVRREATDLRAGYVLYPLESATTVYRIMLDERAVTKVYEGVAGDIVANPSGTAIAFLRRDGTDAALRHMVVVRDVATGVEARYPVASTFTQVGALAFSPDGASLAYAAAVGNPDNEHGEVWVIDLASKVAAEYRAGLYRPSDSESLTYRTVTWLTNEELRVTER